MLEHPILIITALGRAAADFSDYNREAAAAGSRRA